MSSRSVSFWSMVFITASAVAWAAAEGSSYRVLYALVPFLFAFQLVATSLLEDVLVSRLSVGTKRFTLLVAPGTVLHELTHLWGCLATGCQVKRAALFKPNPTTGVLGWVSYTSPGGRLTVIREFIIAFAPFFGCGLMLFALNITAEGGLADLSLIHI